MKVSVILPTRHRNETLARCLERLAPGAQAGAPADYEVIVTDDGSASTAEALVRDRFPWARWTAGPRTGVSANRNHGAGLARGEWLAFTDDDCLPGPAWLSAFAAAADARGDALVLEGSTGTGRPLAGPFETAPVNEEGGRLWACNFAIRAATFRDIGGFDTRFPDAHLEDVDLRTRIEKAGIRPIFVPAARVIHPPRRLGPVAAQALAYESYFYYARKHGVTLRSAGLSWGSAIRWRLASLRRSKSAGEALRYCLRCAAEAVLLPPLCGVWAWRHRSRPARPAWIVCVNSTVPFRRALYRFGRISPVHDWGYEPRPGDVLLAHRLNRFEIALRARLGGVDPAVLAKTGWHLARGASGVYAVTQPDLLRALPLLRRVFPRRRFVTWVWMDWEVDRNLRFLRACDHVLCLSRGAKDRLDAAGLGDRSSMQVWGCPPENYRLASAPPADTDVLLAGWTSRDAALLGGALALGRFSVLTSRTSLARTGIAPGQGSAVEVCDFDTEDSLVAAYHRCGVSWIPLVPGDPYLSGYTNLIESLHCGTAVVIAESSNIPEEVLSLPGVFRYRTGVLEDFVRRTEDALAFSRRKGAREAIAAAASRVLDGARLRDAVRREMGLT
jgi:GT2 family glycosyltransferase